MGLRVGVSLRGLEGACERITQIGPRQPYGLVNIGRARVQEGDMEGARSVRERALVLQPNLARAHYFYARVLKATGKYNDALVHLRAVLAQYPRDRVVRNEVGRILFLQKHYAETIRELNRVLQIDPEALQPNYNLMLCYSGLGLESPANDYNIRYLRSTATESTHSIPCPSRP